jgi:hypothetical protein
VQKKPEAIPALGILVARVGADASSAPRAKRACLQRRSSNIRLAANIVIARSARNPGRGVRGYTVNFFATFRRLK